MSLKFRTFRYLEQEIYDLKDTKKRLEELRKDIIYRTVEKEEIRGTDVSDRTGKAVTRLVMDVRLKRMEEVINAVDCSLGKLDPVKRNILEEKYIRNQYLTWDEVARAWNVDTRTLYRWRSSLVEEIAGKLGME